MSEPVTALSKYSQCGYCGRKPRCPEASLRLCSCDKGTHSESTDFPALCIDQCAECPIDVNCMSRAHLTCWDAMLPRLGRASHQPEAFMEDLQVESILYSETDELKQRELHKRDRRARWFKAEVNSEDGVAVLEVTDRFLELARNGIGQAQDRPPSKTFPCLVSFIGDTGVGKSTLIKALITTSKNENGNRIASGDAFTAPVSAIHNDEHGNEPTSSGVHLYLDPETASTDRPLLFADCEGFRGSNATTNSEYAHQHNPRRSLSWETDESQILLRRLEITAPHYTRGARSEIVEDLYPRFVYVFSDVIVFVINNTKQIMADIKRLLEWCSSGLDASMNHSADKALILMLNKPSEHYESYFNPANAVKLLLGNLKDKVWEDSAKLQEVVNTINQPDTPERYRIFDTMDLVRKFFSRINVCYVPLKGLDGIPKGALYRQYNTLRSLINDAAEERRWQGLRRWTLYNVNDMGRLFDLALEHFAISDKPFDFYEATRKNSPDPKTMEDHITKLLIQIESFDNEKAWKAFPWLVASSLVNVALRGNQIRAEPEQTFDRSFAETCSNGIDTFLRFHSTCKFICSDGSKCGCRYENHTSHRSIDAKRPQYGSFEPADIDKCKRDHCLAIKYAFVDRYRAVNPSRPGFAGSSDPEVAIIRQRLNILASPDLDKFWQATTSFKTCFSCLRSVPHVVLPCSHALCEECFKDFGTESHDVEFAHEVSKCVFCGQSFEERQVHQVKPRYAGTRVLTLDGGGVKGIIELKMLQRLEKMIDLGVPISRFFDLIVGTSTGGIIALGLSMTDLDIKSLIQKFKEISKKTFEFNRAGGNGVIQSLTATKLSKAFFISARLWGSIYRTAPLENELKSLLKSRKEISLFGSAMETGKQCPIKVAVTAVKNEGTTPCMIANYNHTTVIDDDYNDFERGENPDEELKAWEAGLATSAAPIYFTPYCKKETKQVYFDGAIDTNNPVKRALEETKRIWPGSRMDYLLSLGTGYHSKGYTIELPAMFNLTSTQALFNRYLERTHGERTWNHFKKDTSIFKSSIHHRLNPRFSERSCRLDEWRQIETLEEKVDDYFNPKAPGGGLEACQHLEELARTLVAKLFYFHPEKATSDERGGVPFYKVKGKILCRLQKGDPALKLLVQRVEFFSVYNLRYKHPHGVKHVDFDRQAVVASVARGESLVIPDITIGSEDENSEMEISVKLHKTAFDQTTQIVSEIPISGFPCSLKELRQFNVPPGELTANSPRTTPVLPFSPYQDPPRQSHKHRRKHSSGQQQQQPSSSNRYETATVYGRTDYRPESSSTSNPHSPSSHSYHYSPPPRTNTGSTLHEAATPPPMMETSTLSAAPRSRRNSLFRRDSSGGGRTSPGNLGAAAKSYFSNMTRNSGGGNRLRKNSSHSNASRDGDSLRPVPNDSRFVELEGTMPRGPAELGSYR